QEVRASHLDVVHRDRYAQPRPGHARRGDTGGRGGPAPVVVRRFRGSSGRSEETMARPPAGPPPDQPAPGGRGPVPGEPRRHGPEQGAASDTGPQGPPRVPGPYPPPTTPPVHHPAPEPVPPYPTG